MPILSPASLVVNAFAWLFGSFAAVKADLDKVETFFESISKRLESLIPLNKHLVGGRAPVVLQKRIVELFVSCLGICSVGERQVRKRLSKLYSLLHSTLCFATGTDCTIKRHGYESLKVKKMWIRLWTDSPKPTRR